MANQTTERVKKLMVSRYSEWVIRFDVSEYLQNPPMIKKLYEEKQIAQMSVLELEKKVDRLEVKTHKLELDKQRLEIGTGIARRRSIVIFLLSLLAAILVGIGVNIATSQPFAWTGWIMIIAATVLEIISFINLQRGG